MLKWEKIGCCEFLTGLRRHNTMHKTKAMNNGSKAIKIKINSFFNFINKLKLLKNYIFLN
jgi:hypothetical protein